jgi:hypothetical protein
MPKPFEANSNLQEIHKGIYLYKGFLTKKECYYFVKQLSSFKKDSWHKHENAVPGDISGEYWDGKLSIDIIDKEFHDKIINLFAPEFWIFSHSNFLKIDTGESSNTEHSLSQKMEFYKEIIPYKIAVYVSDFSGGEIVFPNIGFEYKPEAGDLLIFKSGIEYEHYTKTVISGTRYVYMDYLIKHPAYYMP